MFLYKEGLLKYRGEGDTYFQPDVGFKEISPERQQVISFQVWNWENKYFPYKAKKLEKSNKIHWDILWKIWDIT